MSAGMPPQMMQPATAQPGVPRVASPALGTPAQAQLDPASAAGPGTGGAATAEGVAAVDPNVQQGQPPAADPMAQGVGGAPPQPGPMGGMPMEGAMPPPQQPLPPGEPQGDPMQGRPGPLDDPMAGFGPESGMAEEPQNPREHQDPQQQQMPQQPGWQPGADGQQLYSPGEGPVTGQVPKMAEAERPVSSQLKGLLSTPSFAAGGITRDGLYDACTLLKAADGMDMLNVAGKAEGARHNGQDTPAAGNGAASVTSTNEVNRVARVTHGDQQKHSAADPQPMLEQLFASKEAVRTSAAGEGNFDIKEKAWSVQGADAWPDSSHYWGKAQDTKLPTKGLTTMKSGEAAPAVKLPEHSIEFVKTCMELSDTCDEFVGLIKDACIADPLLAADLSDFVKMSAGPGLIRGGKKLLKPVTDFGAGLFDDAGTAAMAAGTKATRGAKPVINLLGKPKARLPKIDAPTSFKPKKDFGAGLGPKGPTTPAPRKPPVSIGDNGISNKPGLFRRAGNAAIDNPATRAVGRGFDKVKDPVGGALVGAGLGESGNQINVANDGESSVLPALGGALTGGLLRTRRAQSIPGVKNYLQQPFKMQASGRKALQNHLPGGVGKLVPDAVPGAMGKGPVAARRASGALQSGLGVTGGIAALANTENMIRDQGKAEGHAGGVIDGREQAMNQIAEAANASGQPAEAQGMMQTLQQPLSAADAYENATTGVWGGLNDMYQGATGRPLWDAATPPQTGAEMVETLSNSVKTPEGAQGLERTLDVVDELFSNADKATQAKMRYIGLTGEGMKQAYAEGGDEGLNTLMTDVGKKMGMEFGAPDAAAGGGQGLLSSPAAGGAPAGGSGILSQLLDMGGLGDSDIGKWLGAFSPLQQGFLAASLGSFIVGLLGMATGNKGIGMAGLLAGGLAGYAGMKGPSTTQGYKDMAGFAPEGYPEGLDVSSNVQWEALSPEDQHEFRDSAATYRESNPDTSMDTNALFDMFTKNKQTQQTYSPEPAAAEPAAEAGAF